MKTKIITFITMILFSFFLGFQYNASLHKKAEYQAESKTQVVQEKIKTIIEKVEVPSIVYRDKIVVKYKTINKDIETYRQKEASDTCSVVDDEFVDIFNESVKGVEK